MEAPLDPEPGDAVVIERVLRGDVQAFAALVRKYQASLYRQAIAMVLDPDVAADMVQDAFIRAFTRLASCRDRDRFRAWLFQMLRHRCLDYLKDPRRRNVRIDDVEPPVDSGAGPAELVERERFRRDVKAALARLPAAQREAFLLHYVQEMPYEAMADELGASVSALKMRVLRAREALCATLGPGVTESDVRRLAIRRA